MRIIFDNIIYSLQKSGGGSVYWTELIKRFNDNGKIESVFYDQKEPNENIFRKGISLKIFRMRIFFGLRFVDI